MIATAGNSGEGDSTDFARHMEALERLRRKIESGDLDPVEALACCRDAETHYRAVDTILTRVERELEEMQGPGD